MRCHNNLTTVAIRMAPTKSTNAPQKISCTCRNSFSEQKSRNSSPPKADYITSGDQAGARWRKFPPEASAWRGSERQLTDSMRRQTDGGRRRQKAETPAGRAVGVIGVSRPPPGRELGCGWASTCVCDAVRRGVASRRFKDGDQMPKVLTAPQSEQKWRVIDPA